MIAIIDTAVAASIIRDLFLLRITALKLLKNAFIKSFNMNRGLGLFSGVIGWLNLGRNACDLSAKKVFINGFPPL